MSTKKCKNYKTKKEDKRIYHYCSKQRKEVNYYADCVGCKLIDEKVIKCLKSYTKLKSNSTLKKRTAKQAKIERDRYSLFTEDMDHCIECGLPGINKHEIFYGTGKRKLSIKYGMVIPLCTKLHHDQVNKHGIHFDTELRDKWHKLGQAMFMEHYNKTADEFKEIFGRKYLE